MFESQFGRLNRFKQQWVQNNNLKLDKEKKRKTKNIFLNLGIYNKIFIVNFNEIHNFKKNLIEKKLNYKGIWRP